MVNFEGSCTENLVASNHFLRQIPLCQALV